MFFGKKVEKVLKAKSGENAIIDIDNILTPIFYKNPGKLSEAEKNIVVIEELEREVNNGGFNQFFLNSSGDYCKEICIALESIKSKTFLNIFQRAISMFPNSEVPADREARLELMEQIEGRANPVWNELDKEFYKYSEDIYSLMIDFIRHNIDQFR